jgi:hypothetical protein
LLVGADIVGGGWHPDWFNLAVGDVSSMMRPQPDDSVKDRVDYL